MAVQKSYPWGYLLGPDSLVGYTAKEWAAIYAALARAGGMIVDSGIRTLASVANIGVFYSVANRLAVTSTGSNDILVDTGAALVGGTFFRNPTAFGTANNIVSPAANPRIDRVVVRTNYSAAAYAPTNDATGDFAVPAYTSRITIISGAEAAGPVAPSLTQDTARATYWDIPLYQYQISTLGVITALTDEREWADEGPLWQYRQGGSASVWTTTGATTYNPGLYVQQFGHTTWSGAGAVSGSVSVTFPVAFSALPLVFLSPSMGWDGGVFQTKITCVQGLISAASIGIEWTCDVNIIALGIGWLAIGPR